MENQKHVVTGIWRILRPDTRQYKQQSIEIQLDQLVAVEVPDSMVYKTFDNQQTGELGIILTPEGMRYVQQQFEALYLEPKEDGWDSSLETAKQAVDAKSEGWDDTPLDAPSADSDGWESDSTSAKTDSSDDEWGEDVFGSDTNTPDTESDEKWDEDWA